MSRWPKIFITLPSVLLNLLLLGLVMGHMGHYLMDDHTRRSMEEVAMTLPESKRAHFETTMENTKQDNAPLREQLTDAREKAADILKAPSFDKQAFIAQMQLIQELRGKIMKRKVDAVTGLAQEYSPTSARRWPRC